jgi:integrase
LKKPWQKFRERAGIENLTFHDLRRTIATRQGEAGVSTEIIQRTLGHTESSAATRIYDRSDRHDDVREALNLAIQKLIAAGKTSQKKLLGTGRG